MATGRNVRTKLGGGSTVAAVLAHLESQLLELPPIGFHPACHLLCRFLHPVREFKKQFVLTVLRDLDCNETKAARVLRMHRNTLARTLSELDLDIRALRKTKRRPVRGVDPPRQKKLAS